MKRIEIERIIGRDFSTVEEIYNDASDPVMETSEKKMYLAMRAEEALLYIVNNLKVKEERL